MKYFFILGNNPALSIAEILAVLPASNGWQLVSEQVFILETEEFDAQKMIRRLGGTIKIGVLEGELPNGNYQKMAQAMFGLLHMDKGEGKFKYGISYYGKHRLNTKPIGMEIKNLLKEAGKSARWVVSREPVLSSVVVETNKLISSGAEFVLIPEPDGKKTLIGKTLAVQAFKELSYRDFGRPGRDDHSGMLPPKLAQILINLAVAANTPADIGDGGVVLLDPFCGSGTVLTETMLMGYKNIIGTDISEKAISDSEKNIGWVKEKFSTQDEKFNDLKCETFKLSATELSKKIALNSIGAIATEPYLGPQRWHVDARQTIKELEELYSASLREFRKVLKPGGRVAMVWPVIRETRNRQEAENFLNPDLGGLTIVNPIPDELRQSRIIKMTKRDTIIYGREGQKVWREIAVLEK